MSKISREDIRQAVADHIWETITQMPDGTPTSLIDVGPKVVQTQEQEPKPYRWKQAENDKVIITFGDKSFSRDQDCCRIVISTESVNLERRQTKDGSAKDKSEMAVTFADPLLFEKIYDWVIKAIAAYK